MINLIFSYFHKRKEQSKKEKYLRRYGVDLLCPHCEAWSSANSKPPKITSFGHPIAVKSECAKCGNPSYWVCEAGFWFSAEKFGIHIEQESHHAK